MRAFLNTVFTHKKLHSVWFYDLHAARDSWRLKYWGRGLKHKKTVAEKLQNKIDNLVNSIMQNTHI